MHINTASFEFGTIIASSYEGLTISFPLESITPHFPSEYAAKYSVVTTLLSTLFPPKSFAIDITTITIKANAIKTATTFFIFNLPSPLYRLPLLILFLLKYKTKKI